MSTLPTALDQLLMKPMAVNGTPVPTRQYLNLITASGNVVDNPAGVGGVGSTDVTMSAGAGWPYGPFFTTTAPIVASTWADFNFTQQGTQTTAPTFVDIAGKPGIAMKVPTGTTNWQGKELILASPSNPWTYEIGITANLKSFFTATPSSGATLRCSTTGTFVTWGSGVNVGATVDIYGIFAEYSSPTSSPSSSLLFSGPELGVPLLLKAVYDGMNITGSFSLDGVNFLPVLGPVAPSFFGGNIDRLGVGATPQGADAALLIWHQSLTSP
jgi:hypothetical protein